MIQIMKDGSDALNTLSHQEQTERALPYYFNGIFPMIYKFCRGMYFLYSYTEDIKEYLDNNLLLHKTVTDLSKYVKEMYNIDLSQGPVMQESTNRSRFSKSTIIPSLYSAESKTEKKSKPLDD